MADLSCNVGGIKAPNPFWLASAPPTDKLYNVERAFRAGWERAGMGPRSSWRPSSLLEWSDYS